MSSDDMCQLVADRISLEHKSARKCAADIAAQKKVVADDDIVTFFPQFQEKLHGRKWGNRPQGVSLKHFLLLGPTPVLDLQPVPKHEFKERHGISLEAALRLAENGLLIPSIYVRNPLAWDGMDYLRELVEQSFVNGERVDAYFSLREPRFTARRRRSP